MKVIKILRKILLYLIACILLFIFMYPIYFIAISCVKQSSDIFISPFLPSSEIHLENFARAFEFGLGRQFINSMVLSLGTLVLSSILASMISFAISRLRFRGQTALRVYFVMGMMVPIQSIIVILAYITNLLNLSDNYIFLICLYTAFYMPLSIFVVTGYMYGLPASLEEAAVIDGCNIYQVFFKIILPLTRPALATVSIFVFMYTWNDLLTAMVLIHKTSLTTVSVGLLQFTGAYNSDYGALMAAIVIAILPPFLMYVVMQENVVKGITSGANK